MAEWGTASPSTGAAFGLQANYFLVASKGYNFCPEYPVTCYRDEWQPCLCRTRHLSASRTRQADGRQEKIKLRHRRGHITAYRTACPWPRYSGAPPLAGRGGAVIDFSVRFIFLSNPQAYGYLLTAKRW